MSSYSQQQQFAPAAYPQQQTAYPPPGQAYMAPPPAGYPMMDKATSTQKVPIQTKSRGDGFWEGCCAALCCCCVLETCF